MYLKKELYGLIRTDESIFDFIQESALDGLWYWDLENPANEWMNAKFWTVLGYNPDEMPHKSNAWQNIINQDDLKVANDNFAKHCENPNHPYDQVVRYTHKNGSTVWIRCRGLAIRDKDGKPIRMLGAHQDVSELKNSEQQLLKSNEKVRESEEKYRAFYENAPLSYQSLDENGCFIDINPMWLKTLGYAKEEVIGKWYGDFLHPDYVEHFRINFPAFKKRGYITNVQFKLRKKDNTFIYVSFEGCVGYTPEGKFKQTYCVFKDITIQRTLENELIKAKKATEESEEKFRTFVENANDIIYQVSSEGVFTYVSPNWTEILGYQLDEVLGEKVEKFAHPDDLQLCIDFLNKVLTTGKKQSGVEYRVKHKNGTWRWHNSSGAPLKDENGNIVSYLGVGRDVTEKVQAQQKLLLSETKYKAAFHTSPDSVNINKLNGEFVEINEGFTRLTGFTEDEVIGRLSSEIDIWAIPEDRTKLIDGLEKDGIFENLETMFRTKDGRLVPGLMSARIFYLNQEPHILSVTRDITEHKKSIAALQQIEWMLTEKKIRHENPIPEYGDLSEQNAKGLILSLVGKEQLIKIASEYLDLLETSSAIYERNGDYALGLFSSSWCQMMDSASRKLCNTDSNAEALTSGKWLCHESCWKDASLVAINSGRPADVKCKGGIRLFAVPIKVNGKVIGAINFGYGKPPTAEDKLQDLAALYQVPIDELRKRRQEYQIRPQFIIDYAKRRIQLSAQYLGNLIEHKQAELLLQEKSEEIATQNEELYQTNQELSDAIEKAEASEQRFKSLIENAPDGVVIINQSGKIIYGSPNAARQFCYSENDILGHSGDEFTHPDDLPLVLKTMETIFNDPLHKPKVKYRFKRKDGEYRWIETTFTNLISDKAINGIILNFTDITERKQMLEDLVIAKEKAEESEERFNLAMKASNDGLFDWNLETNEIYYSPGWKKMLGYEENELPDDFSVWEKTTDPEDIKKSWELHQKVITKQIDRFVIEFKMKHKDGHWVDILSRAEAFFDDNGKAVRFIGTHTDISERKKAEKERQEKEQLEKKILLSEESLKFKQNFLANMSHEIRTPLTGILGMAEILSKTKLDNEQTDYLNTILISGENLREIINNVLDFSKIEAGKMQLKMKVFPLQNLYDTAESLFKSTCKKPITFKYTNDPQLPAYIKSDENRIKQVINNIISNAVKFTSKGEIHLLTQLQHYKPGSRFLEIKISVSDTGVGIPEYLQEKLFRPFSQIDNRDIRQFEGTGLGLSICKNLVKMLGGEIGVQSSPNKGSTFWFTFTAEETTPFVDPKANAMGRYSRNPLNLRILLAEDKLVTQKVINLHLKSLGHEVTMVGNGEKVVEIFDPAKFDLILMDIQMPVMDGITAAQLLKKRYENLPPIVGLSANAFEGDREKYIEQGMDEYLTKPFVVADFVSLIDELFGMNDVL